MRLYEFGTIVFTVIATVFIVEYIHEVFKKEESDSYYVRPRPYSQTNPSQPH